MKERSVSLPPIWGEDTGEGKRIEVRGRR